MGVTSYIAADITTNESTVSNAEIEGAYQYTQQGYYAWSRLKLEETAYDAAAKKSTIKVSIEVKAPGMQWPDGEYFVLNERIAVKVNGIEVEWNRYGKEKSEEYLTIADGTVEIDGRAAGTKQLTVEVSSTAPARGRFACWAYQGNILFPICNAGAEGEYNIEASTVSTGSRVMIGGEAYEILIGNGAGWDKVDAYIGAGAEWIKH